MEFNHLSVLLNECIEGLAIKSEGIYVDGTLGGAGHSKEIVNKLNENGLFIGIDRDESAIEAASKVLGNQKNIVLVRDNFSNIINILDKQNIDKIDGMLLDLGVSSHQLDEASRGFSYIHDAPLDMRMDNRDLKTAYSIVNEYSQKEIEDVIFNYGEERWARRIAEFIVEERKTKTIDTTFELVTIIKKAVPKGARLDGPHPAKRTFQAIRIEVNSELSILEKTVENIISRMKSGGRLCIITFHSLEDRIIKNVYKKLKNPCTCPQSLPFCACGKTSEIEIITRRPIIPSEDELSDNHRSRSAKLRICEKL